MERREKICSSVRSHWTDRQKIEEEKERWPAVRGNLGELWKARLLFVICRKKCYQKVMQWWSKCGRLFSEMEITHHAETLRARRSEQREALAVCEALPLIQAIKGIRIPWQWCPNDGFDCTQVDVLCWWNKPWRDLEGSVGRPGPLIVHAPGKVSPSREFAPSWVIYTRHQLLLVMLKEV